MLKLIVMLSLWLVAGSAAAQSCPDFYRFVDFGLADATGNVQRGGPVFRAESFAGEALLINEKTACLLVTDLARDGRGNPIPVVSAIGYDPSRAGLDLSELRVAVLSDLDSAVALQGQEHRDAIHREGAGIRQGATYLCADRESGSTASCQIVSPFPGGIDLFVYCDATQCRMPILAVNNRIAASAGWLREDHGALDLNALGANVSVRIEKIHAFLSPLASGI